MDAGETSTGADAGARPRLFTLDTVMVDVVLVIDSLPSRGGDAVASRHLVSAGGGFNVMSAAARQGMAVVYAGQVGTGPFADIVHAALAREGVVTPVAADGDHDAGLCVVLVDREGERTFATAPGAETLLERAALERLDVRAGDYVFLSGYSLVYERIGASVTQWLAGLDDGVIVAFDPGPRVGDIRASWRAAVLERADWLLANAAEARAIARRATIDEALEVLAESTGRRGVVVHDGAAGCVVVRRGEAPRRVAAFPGDVVDTNGAGDVHDGVFLAGLADGADPVLAARRANAAASIAITRFGPATCPTSEEIRALVAH
ncbi:MAG: PfkB family carbohydrate kinase [Acidimicrobiales bacterium]